MNAHFMTFSYGPPEDVSRPPSNVGARKQGAVEQGPDAIVANDRCATDFFEKPPAEDTTNGSACMIRAYTEQEGCLDFEALEQVE